MIRILSGIAFLATLTGTVHTAELNLPLHPDEAAILRGIIDVEKLDVESAEMPGYSKNGVLKLLEGNGVDPKSLQTSAIAVKGKPQMVLSFAYDLEGRVVALSGNGPWLRNSSLRALKDMPELRCIRIDHNGFVGNDPRILEFDGSGFEALADSKLADVKIGLSFSDQGMEQCAKIKSLRAFSVAHSRATEAGIAFFAGHTGLKAFSIGEMASRRVSEKALAAIAKIPNLTHVGFKECYVTYDGGFALLAPLKGKLLEIDLSMCAAAQSDLDKLKADHPQANIITTPPAEIPKRHIGVAMNLAKQVPPDLAAPLNAAIELYRKK
jgi:hypothetical protein